MRPGHSTRRTIRPLVGTLVALGLLLAACSGSGDEAASPSAPGTPTATCQGGSAGIPADVYALTVNGQPFERFSTPLTVPYAGLGATMPPDRPVYLKVEVTTNVAGAPVTFSASGGKLVDAVTAQQWQKAPDTLKVIAVAGPSSCTATAYLFATQVGQVQLLVNGNTTNQGMTIPVVTVKEAARNLVVTTDVKKVPASTPILTSVAVTDVFGNAVSGASIDLKLATNGPGRFDTGANTATITTDNDGTADIQIQTQPGKGKTLRITASGDEQTCTVGRNSYACKADQPVPGFPAASGPQQASVEVIPPSAQVLAPQDNTLLTVGETFDVVAQTTAVPTHTQASVLVGGLVVATGAVAKDGSLQIPGVPVKDTQQMGDYTLQIGDTITKNLDVRGLPFGITDYNRVQGRIDFVVQTGAFPAGTPVVLTLDDEVWKRAQVVKARQDLIISVKDRNGTYQVQVTKGGVTITGDKPVVVKGLA